MGDYFVPIVDVLRAAGCTVAENSTTAGWERRARGSGGFDSAGAILGVQWHHTASSTSPANDLAYMISGSPDEPVGNVLIDRTGTCWPVAAGAANTSGKGGPSPFSRGTVPKDSGNTRLFSLEIANNGVGEPWPQVQIDAAFRASNALNAHFGNQPSDVITHALGAGDGYTDRKIDPATAAAVQGPWKPVSTNSSGTWRLAELRNECARRAGTLPPPQPPSGDDDDMKLYAGTGPDGTVWVGNGVQRRGVNSEKELDEMIYHSVRNQGPTIVKYCDGLVAQSKQELWKCKLADWQLPELGADVADE